MILGKTMQKPIVSIIISAYNAEKYIEQTIQSVLSQTWQPLEIIVVNDGSTDNTQKIVERFISQSVKIINQSNKGQDAALNEGFRQSNGDYIKFMDSDDLINPSMIERQVETLNGSKDFIAYSEWARFYGKDFQQANFKTLKYWKDSLPLDFLTAEPNGVMLQCGIMLIPKQIIEQAGLWDERLILFNDTEFFTRIIVKSKGIKFSSGAKLYYRSGIPDSVSRGSTRKYYESTFLATNLIAKKLLSVEDSVRIRRLISNTFLMQLYSMYPKFPDLIKMHEEKIKLYGEGTYKIGGGIVLRILTKLLGWKRAKKIQLFFYGIRYTKHLSPPKQNLIKKLRK